MKNLLKITIAFALLIPSGIKAQTKANSTNKTESSSVQIQEYAFMEKGKMIEYTNNEFGYLLDDFVCTNGDKVSENGTLTQQQN